MCICTYVSTYISTYIYIYTHRIVPGQSQRSLFVFAEVPGSMCEYATYVKHMRPVRFDLFLFRTF